MQSTHELGKQNQALLRDLSRIATQLRLGSEHNGEILRRELLEIADKIKQHHQLEAQMLYPELAAKGGAVRRAAAWSDRKLTDADHQLERFLGRWATGESIDAHHAAFAEDAARLVTRLRSMLVREASELLR